MVLVSSLVWPAVCCPLVLPCPDDQQPIPLLVCSGLRGDLPLMQILCILGNLLWVWSKEGCLGENASFLSRLPCSIHPGACCAIRGTRLSSFVSCVFLSQLTLFPPPREFSSHRQRSRSQNGGDSWHHVHVKPVVQQRVTSCYWHVSYPLSSLLIEITTKLNLTSFVSFDSKER